MMEIPYAVEALSALTRAADESEVGQILQFLRGFQDNHVLDLTTSAQNALQAVIEDFDDLNAPAEEDDDLEVRSEEDPGIGSDEEDEGDQIEDGSDSHLLPTEAGLYMDAYGNKFGRDTHGTPVPNQPQAISPSLYTSKAGVVQGPPAEWTPPDRDSQQETEGRWPAGKLLTENAPGAPGGDPVAAGPGDGVG